MNPTDTQTNDGGPASGASLRDEAAMRFIAALLSNPNLKLGTKNGELVECAFELADVFLRIRALPAPPKEEAP